MVVTVGWRDEHMDIFKCITVARRNRTSEAFTLVEAVMSLLVVGIMVGGLLSLYTQSAIRAEWSAYSLAANMMAVRGLEQTRAAKWDPNASTPVDEVVSSNFTNVVDVLDLGPAGAGTMSATNVTTIQNLSTSPPLKLVQVQCIWPFPRKNRSFTNTIFTYRAPDQ